MRKTLSTKNFSKNLKLEWNYNILQVQDIPRFNENFQIIIEKHLKNKNFVKIEQEMYLLLTKPFKNIKDNKTEADYFQPQTYFEKLYVKTANFFEFAFKNKLYNFNFTKICEILTLQLLNIKDISVKKSHPYFNPAIILYFLENENIDIVQKKFYIANFLKNQYLLTSNDYIITIKECDRLIKKGENFRKLLQPLKIYENLDFLNLHFGDKKFSIQELIFALENLQSFPLNNKCKIFEFMIKKLENVSTNPNTQTNDLLILIRNLSELNIINFKIESLMLKALQNLKFRFKTYRPTYLYNNSLLFYSLIESFIKYRVNDMELYNTFLNLVFKLKKLEKLDNNEYFKIIEKFFELYPEQLKQILSEYYLNHFKKDIFNADSILTMVKILVLDYENLELKSLCMEQIMKNLEENLLIFDINKKIELIFCLLCLDLFHEGDILFDKQLLFKFIDATTDILYGTNTFNVVLTNSTDSNFTNITKFNIENIKKPELLCLIFSYYKNFYKEFLEEKHIQLHSEIVDKYFKIHENNIEVSDSSQTDNSINFAEYGFKQDEVYYTKMECNSKSFLQFSNSNKGKKLLMQKLRENFMSKLLYNDLNKHNYIIKPKLITDQNDNLQNFI